MPAINAPRWLKEGESLAFAGAAARRGKEGRMEPAHPFSSLLLQRASDRDGRRRRRRGKQGTWMGAKCVVSPVATKGSGEYNVGAAAAAASETQTDLMSSYLLFLVFLLRVVLQL